MFNKNITQNYVQPSTSFNNTTSAFSTIQDLKLQNQDFETNSIASSVANSIFSRGGKKDKKEKKEKKDKKSKKEKKSKHKKSEGKEEILQPIATTRTLPVPEPKHHPESKSAEEPEYEPKPPKLANSLSCHTSFPARKSSETQQKEDPPKRISVQSVKPVLASSLYDLSKNELNLNTDNMGQTETKIRTWKRTRRNNRLERDPSTDEPVQENRKEEKTLERPKSPVVEASSPVEEIKRDVRAHDLLEKTENVLSEKKVSNFLLNIYRFCEHDLKENALEIYVQSIITQRLSLVSSLKFYNTNFLRLKGRMIRFPKQSPIKKNLCSQKSASWSKSWISIKEKMKFAQRIVTRTRSLPSLK